MPQGRGCPASRVDKTGPMVATCARFGRPDQRAFLYASLAFVCGALVLGCSSDGQGTDRAGRTDGDPSESTGNNQTGEGSPSSGSSEKTSRISLQKVGVELDRPIAAIPGAAADSMIIAERGGTVRILTFGTGTSGASIPASLSDPIIDISSETSTDSERGLLGIAMSPDRRRFFISYTAANDGSSHLDAFDVAGADDRGRFRVDTSSRINLLTVDQPFPNHNGGDIAIGPDGMLYMGLGDGGGAGDPYGNAQNPSKLLGKILRLNPSASGPGDIAAEGNPGFGRAGSGAEVWITGVRNPWRFSFDAETGDLWIADVGQNEWEEIDFLSRDSGLGKGANLGWNLYEGSQKFADPNPASGAASSGPFVQPVYTYRHGPGCSITGGVVYRGRKIPSLVGTYLFSDYCDPTIRGLHSDAPEGTADPVGPDSRFKAVDFGVTSSQVASFATDPNGETYVLSLDRGLFRIVGADTVGK